MMIGFEVGVVFEDGYCFGIIEEFMKELEFLNWLVGKICVEFVFLNSFVDYCELFMIL